MQPYVMCTDETTTALYKYCRIQHYHSYLYIVTCDVLRVVLYKFCRDVEKLAEYVLVLLFLNNQQSCLFNYKQNTVNWLIFIFREIGSYHAPIILMLFKHFHIVESTYIFMILFCFDSYG